jgi:hexaprenyl-diphosphate synthase
MSSRLSSRTCLLFNLQPPQFHPRRSRTLSLVKLVSPNITQHHRRQSTWEHTLSSASKLVQDPTAQSSILPGNFPFPSIVNPLKLVAPEMTSLTGNIRMLLGSGHPTLAKVAKYYISSEGGKHIRPLVVLLVSKALSYNKPRISDAHDQDVSISPVGVLSDTNPDHPVFDETATTSGDITPSQRRLAEITEMIHAASLLHDDVIDASPTRRNNPSCVSMFGNKMSILGGDFLLGRASVALARLRNAEVVELIATVIANLVEGEFMQLKNLETDNTRQESAIDYYLRKTYLKTASLISKSCRSAAILGGSAEDVTDAAYAFGRNLGLAFQVAPMRGGNRSWWMICWIILPPPQSSENPVTQI